MRPPTPSSRRSLVVSSLLGALLAALGCGGEPVSDETPNSDLAAASTEDDSDPGRDAWVLPDEMGGIYAEHCAVCHGANLEGASLGSSLLVDPLVHGDSVDAVVASISEGFPEKQMPPWKEALSPDDIRGLAIYLLEKRSGGDREAEQGIGAPPAIPTEPIATRHHPLVIEPVYGGLQETYSLAPLPDGRILVTEKMRGVSLIAADGSSATRIAGMPRVYDDAVVRGTTFSGSGWAHEIALHPDYEDNGWIYYSYGDRCQDCNAASIETGQPVSMLKLVRGRLDGHRWVDQQTIWEADKAHYLPGAENGASARIAFDDRGYVYMTIGQFTDYTRVQDLGAPDGKIIRMHDDGRVPEDNPFVDVPGALPSIWTLGHRNAQGLDFDPASGRLWSSEHGPRGGDEANLILPGHNYGWPAVSLGVDYDGRPLRYAEKYGLEFDPADMTTTKIDWTPSPGVSSIVFYHGERFPRWRGHLLVATLARNDLWRYVVDENGERERETLIRGLGRFRDIEVGPSGEILVLLEHQSGTRILRIDRADS